MPKKTTIVELTPTELAEIIREHVVEAEGIKPSDNASFIFEGWSMQQGSRVQVECESLACKITFTQAPKQEKPTRKAKL